MKAARRAIAATVITMRATGFTFREIGEQLGITRQRAQQIWAEHERKAAS